MLDTNTNQTIQIKVTIPGSFLHDGIEYSQDDVSTEPLELGQYFIRAGWAIDTSGSFTAPIPASTDVVLLVENTTSPTLQPGV